MTEQAQHTPGPWTAVEYGEEGSGWWGVLQGAWDISHNRAAEPGVIADSKYSAMTPAENDANARLIAAAPELLRATIALQQALRRHPGNSMERGHALTLGAAAITTAEGSQP